MRLVLAPQSVAVVLVALLLACGCAQKQPDLSFKEITDHNCHFVKQQVPETPDKLIENYLRRDAAGEFTLVSGWFDSVTLCPGREGAPEVTYVARHFHVRKVEISQGKARVEVEYDITGALEPGVKESWVFVKRPSKTKRTFDLVHTSYGWRIQNARLADGQFISIATSKRRRKGKL